MERQEGGAGTSGSCQGMGRSPIVLAGRRSRCKVAARNVRMPAGMRTSWQGGRERKAKRKAPAAQGTAWSGKREVQEPQVPARVWGGAPSFVQGGEAAVSCNAQCSHARRHADELAGRGKRNARPLLLKERHGAARGRCRNLRFLLSAEEERNQQPKQRPRSAVRNERQAEGAAATIENRGGRNFIALTKQRSCRKTVVLNDCCGCVNAK